MPSTAPQHQSPPSLLTFFSHFATALATLPCFFYFFHGIRDAPKLICCCKSMKVQGNKIINYECRSHSQASQREFLRTPKSNNLSADKYTQTTRRDFLRLKQVFFGLKQILDINIFARMFGEVTFLQKKMDQTLWTETCWQEMFWILSVQLSTLAMHGNIKNSCRT